VAITALPVWATLSTEYLEDGARLYYFPSVGIALAWASLCLLTTGAGWRRALSVLGVAVLLGLATWQALEFQGPRRAMYADGTRLLLTAAAASRARPPDGGVLFVNLPAWQAPVEAAFPLGNTGVTYVPEYVLLGQALHVNGGRASGVESLATRELEGGWPNHYGPHGAWVDLAELLTRADAEVARYVVQYTPEGPQLIPWLRDAAAPAAISGR
jgi:hypothetical protein